MSDIQKRHFYKDAVPLLEELVEMYEEQEFDEDDIDETDEDAINEQSILNTFISKIKDSLEIAEEHS